MIASCHLAVLASDLFDNIEIQTQEIISVLL